MNLKQEAARNALELVRDGMCLGLGSGSTTTYFIEMLGKHVLQGKLQGIKAVPTSEKTAALARTLGIPLTTLARHPRLDLVVDGADEVDPQLNLIKGLGRALLREKIIAVHADKFAVIVDESKIVSRLGSRVALPVEIVKFEFQSHVNWLNTLGCKAELWTEGQESPMSGEPVVTDNGNYLALCWFGESEFGGIPDAHALARALADRPGIVENGLFLDMADRVIVAGADGVRIQERGT
jgi:ribose 5-phosphate isomerase A